jgi:hypothetical protein
MSRLSVFTVREPYTQYSLQSDTTNSNTSFILCHETGGIVSVFHRGLVRESIRRYFLVDIPKLTNARRCMKVYYTHHSMWLVLISCLILCALLWII